MNWLQRYFGRGGNPHPDDGQQSVLVYLPLSDGEFGHPDERAAIHGLEGALAAAIEVAQAGELDGDEFGAGEATLFMYGPSADLLFAAIEPVLRASPLARNARVVLRYGPPGTAETTKSI